MTGPAAQALADARQAEGDAHGAVGELQARSVTDPTVTGLDLVSVEREAGLATSRRQALEQAAADEQQQERRQALEAELDRFKTDEAAAMAAFERAIVEAEAALCRLSDAGVTYARVVGAVDSAVAQYGVETSPRVWKPGPHSTLKVDGVQVRPPTVAAWMQRVARRGMAGVSAWEGVPMSRQPSLTEPNPEHWPKAVSEKGAK